MESLISRFFEKYGYTECLELLPKQIGKSGFGQRTVHAFYNYIQRIGQKRSSNKLSFTVS